MRGIRLLAIASGATLVTLIGGLIPASAATPPPVSWLTYTSGVGDPIGRSTNVTTKIVADGLTTVMQKSGRRKMPLRVWFTIRDAKGYVGTWTIDLMAPTGLVLKPGHYDNVEQFPNQTAGHAGMNVSALGQSCTKLTGSFDIAKITYGGHGVAKLDATIVQYCNGSSAPLVVTVHVV